MRTGAWYKSSIAVISAVAVLGSGACADSESGGASTSSTAATTESTTAIDIEAVAGRVPPSIQKAGRLVVATNAPFAPMEFQRGDDLVGFDVDLVEAIAAHLELDVEFKQVRFASVVTTVADGGADLAARGLFDTKERERQIDMVSYLRAGTQWARRTGTDVDPYDACGTRVGAEKATTQADVELPAKSDACEVVGEPPLDIVEFETETEVFQALTAGRVDAVSVDSPVALYAAAQSAGAIEPAGHAFDTRPYAFGVAKGSELGPVLSAVVQSMIDSGELEEIAQRWGLERGVVHRSLLNAAVA